MDPSRVVAVKLARVEWSKSGEEREKPNINKIRKSAVHFYQFTFPLLPLITTISFNHTISIAAVHENHLKRRAATENIMP